MIKDRSAKELRFEKRNPAEPCGPAGFCQLWTAALFRRFLFFGLYPDRQALQLRSTVKSQSGGKAPQFKSKKQNPAEPCGPAGFLSLVRQAPAIPTRDRRFHHGLLVSLTHNLSS